MGSGEREGGIPLTTNFRCVKKNSFIEEPFAGVAQPVEQLICNQQVAGSSPIASSKREGFPSGQRGQTVNLLAKPSEVRILPPPPYSPEMVAEVKYAGIAQLARASAFQAEGRGFESRFPLQDSNATCEPTSEPYGNPGRLAALFKESRCDNLPT